MSAQERDDEHEELSRAAYRFWEERGCPHGSPEIDWQRAEEEAAQKGGRGPAGGPPPDPALEASAAVLPSGAA